MEETTAKPGREGAAPRGGVDVALGHHMYPEAYKTWVTRREGDSQDGCG